MLCVLVYVCLYALYLSVHFSCMCEYCHPVTSMSTGCPSMLCVFVHVCMHYSLYHFVHFSYVCQYCHAVASLSTCVSVCVCPRRCWRTWWCVQPRNRTPAACACYTCPRYPTRCTWWTSSTAPLPLMPSHRFPPLTS